MTKRILKAYERYDYNGKVVPGSLVLRDRIPKNGKWKEVQTYLCCNFELDPNCIYFTIEATEGDLDFWFNLTIVSDGGPSVIGTINWGDGESDSFSIIAEEDVQFDHTFPNAGLFSGTLCVSDPSRITKIQAEIND
jgi:hypothetical protein